MPYPNVHAARILNPNRFQPGSFRTIKLTDGVNAIIGRLKGQTKTTTQSIRFDKNKFTVAEAKAWLKENDVKYIMFEAATEEVEAFSVPIKLLYNHIMSFNQNDIIKKIPENILAKIKQKDPHPFFTMYSICHEGISTPIIVGEESQKISWPRRAIQSIKNVITRGVKLFKGHNKDGSHAGRKVLGRIIHSFEQKIDGILHHIIIAYHKSDVIEEVKKYNVCSQEAFWNIIKDAGKLIAHTMDKLTGIALGNSKQDVPAFAGAKRLGFIQAFNPSGKDGNKLSGKDKDKEGEIIMAQKNSQTIDDQITDDGNQTVDDSNQTNQNNGGNQNSDQFLSSQKQQKRGLTYSEIKEEIKRSNIYPSHLFSEEDLKRDKNFSNVFNQIEILKEEKEKMELQITELTRTAALSTVPDRIENIIKGEKVPLKIADFIRDRFESQKDKIADLSDKGIKEFIQSETELFQTVSRTIDPEFDIEQQENSGAESGDMTKAENNPLLEEDLNIE